MQEKTSEKSHIFRAFSSHTSRFLDKKTDGFLLNPSVLAGVAGIEPA